MNIGKNYHNDQENSCVNFDKIGQDYLFSMQKRVRQREELS